MWEKNIQSEDWAEMWKKVKIYQVERKEGEQIRKEGEQISKGLMARKNIVGTEPVKPVGWHDMSSARYVGSDWTGQVGLVKWILFSF